MWRNSVGSVGWVIVATAASVLAACGSKEPGNATSASGATTTKSTQSSGDATAAEVAEEARGDVDCPPRIKSAARDAKAPVDDVVGVRPGMTYEEAANVVMCTNDLIVVQADTSRGFDIKTYGQTLRQGFSARFAEPRVVKTSKQIMEEMQDDFIARSGNAVRQDMKPGQSKWYVGTMGMPGQERVFSAAREEWFEEGHNPTVGSVEQALLKKYGTPTRHQPPAGGRIYLTWAYDTFGRLVTETSPLFNQCQGVNDPNGGANLSPDCGLVVSAIAFPMTDNPALAQFIQVGVVDQARGYEALTATDQAFQQQEAQRRAKEVEAAAKNADAPEL